MRSIAFDLGDTLIEYEGLPPSWESHYDSALARLAAFARCETSDATLAAARAVLRKYNTRLAPRTHEVPFSAILEELMTAFGADVPPFPDAAAAFFSVFRQRLRCFPDTEVAVSFGCEAVLLDRSGAAPSWGQHRTIHSLAELTPSV